MHKFLLAAAAIGLLRGQLWGQSAREFDAVSIKPYEPKGPPYEACNAHNDPSRFNLVGCPLRQLVHLAYNLKPYQMSPKGPPWIDTDSFVIQAHTTAAANNRQMMEMLQPILTERFHLTLRWADEQVPAYLLEVATHGLKLEAATKTDRCGETIFKTEPVSNRTGLHKDARYRFNLEFRPGDDPAGEAVVPSILAALPDQLGLTLKAGKAPVHMLFIDRALRPEAN